MECVSCASITDKYKCSKCLAPYCSVNCYKEHKTQPECTEIAAVKQAPQPAKNVNEEEPTIYAPFSTEDTVPLDRLEQLKNSEPLRQLLHNPHLRALLQQIDVAYNANLAMTAAMQEPLFVEFANACLQVVEPMTEAERAERAELELCS
ncbi:zinc finger HIT domain-containing protein 3 isoform X1 [Drosophila novamexicana]|uniref:zinc finger HIT domain-containing protein 3 isoform X1 n=1 Tax=Drosophila novamexicana TaxID=47314 RepID=UPI0011E5EBF2|nr:zinc finger HIT domain-containing protein 3 isoform X1 [Drosophila novamexicana]